MLHAMATPSLLDSAKLIEQYLESEARLFLLDWDGTLTPIVGDPKAAVPTAADIGILDMLSSNPKNDVWIISGRDSTFLQKHLGSLSSLGLSAEHGAYVRLANHADWHSTSEEADSAWQVAIMAILNDYTAKTLGSWVEKKAIAITWHYRNALPEIADSNATECKNYIEQIIPQLPSHLEVMDGKMCLEVRPKNVNKGAIVRSIIASYGGRTCPDFVLCTGDDVTDEGESPA